MLCAPASDAADAQLRTGCARVRGCLKLRQGADDGRRCRHGCRQRYQRTFRSISVGGHEEVTCRRRWSARPAWGRFRIIRTSSGVARVRIDVISPCKQIDLPDPVVPAISRCGILARLATITRPSTGGACGCWYPATGCPADARPPHIVRGLRAVLRLLRRRLRAMAGLRAQLRQRSAHRGQRRRPALRRARGPPDFCGARPDGPPQRPSGGPSCSRCRPVTNCCGPRSSTRVASTYCRMPPMDTLPSSARSQRSAALRHHDRRAEGVAEPRAAESAMRG